MPIDFHNPVPRHERLQVDWRAPPRCYARSALSEAVEAAQDDAGSARVFPLSVLLSIISAITALLLVKSGWSF